MKRVYIIILSLLLISSLFQGWVYYMSSVEEQPYRVIKKFGEVEIRHYPAARMASVNMAAQEDLSSNGFRMLAGYIFGGNEAKQEFAMTAPVHMSKSDSSSTMSFVLPEDAWNSELPAPNDERVNLHWSEPTDVAAIQFSGYVKQDVYLDYKKRLVNHLDSLSIKHNGNFTLLGYDPPFKTTGRRNEILVGIDKSTIPD